MRRITNPSFPIVIMLLCTGCFYFFGEEVVEISIPDVSKGFEKQIEVKAEGKRGVYKLLVKATGQLDQKCMINSIELGPEKVDTIVYCGDHYAPEYFIRYEPLQTTTGQLKLELTFFY